jgi:GT2 family glycosyltransferase
MSAPVSAPAALRPAANNNLLSQEDAFPASAPATPIIAAIVVTHDRLALLRDCIAAIRKQNRPPNFIFVVNNASSDGTAEWLQTQPDIIAINQTNEGGSGGFFTGIKTAYAKKTDFVWLLDDDSLPEPRALSELLKTSQNCEQFFLGSQCGWTASVVRWTDGKVHKMNIPEIKAEEKSVLMETAALGFLPAGSASFVSLLVNVHAIEKAGLPLREFVIWGDDVEWTKRIIKNNFRGALSLASVCFHKTNANENFSMKSYEKNNSWKLRFGIRNKLWLHRKQHEWRIFIRYVFRTPVKLLFAKKYWAIPLFARSCFASLSFHPKTEFL